MVRAAVRWFDNNLTSLITTVLQLRKEAQARKALAASEGATAQPAKSSVTRAGAGAGAGALPTESDTDDGGSSATNSCGRSDHSFVRNDAVDSDGSLLHSGGEDEGNAATYTPAVLNDGTTVVNTVGELLGLDTSRLRESEPASGNGSKPPSPAAQRPTWTLEQQLQLDAAIEQANEVDRMAAASGGTRTHAQRWTAIASGVTAKSLAECVQRFCELRQAVRRFEATNAARTAVPGGEPTAPSRVDAGEGGGCGDGATEFNDSSDARDTQSRNTLDGVGVVHGLSAFAGRGRGRGRGRGGAGASAIGTVLALGLHQSVAPPDPPARPSGIVVSLPQQEASPATEVDAKREEGAASDSGSDGDGVDIVTEQQVVPAASADHARPGSKISLHPNRRGTQVMLEELFLFGGGVVEVNELRLLCSCTKCATPVEVALTDASNDGGKPFQFRTWCKKCSSLLRVTLRPELAHTRNPSLGYLGELHSFADACVAVTLNRARSCADLSRCSAIDLLPSTVLVSCMGCSSQV